VSDGREGKRLEASSPILGKVKLDYQATTTVDVFDGPLFEMRPAEDGTITPVFIPWHRQWSHSPALSLLFGGVAGLIWGPLAGIVALAAHAAHVLLDQLGFLGSNLLFPFRAKRMSGLKLVHSNDAFVNFGAVWLSVLLVYWNLSRGLPEDIVSVSPAKLVFYGVLIPAGIYWVLRRRLAR
jgi:membrane-bound metal-dependent hydrolase YbcI (DUF457 family)